MNQRGRVSGRGPLAVMQGSADEAEPRGRAFPGRAWERGKENNDYQHDFVY